MSALVLGECEACGARMFPVPLWCHVCGSDRIGEVTETSGTVTETTIVRHAAGRPLAPIRIATVHLTGGGVVIARLDAAGGEGDRVEISVEDGAPVARP